MSPSFWWNPVVVSMSRRCPQTLWRGSQFLTRPLCVTTNWLWRQTIGAFLPRSRWTWPATAPPSESPWSDCVWNKRASRVTRNCPLKAGHFGTRTITPRWRLGGDQRCPGRMEAKAQHPCPSLEWAPSSTNFFVLPSWAKENKVTVWVKVVDRKTSAERCVI